ncbi:hypothetical protein K503DRAFT_677759 [Rhizopogon vinicolor AM-OR11-026]|uniref:FMR1-interacting protein 1 conserved domain-containing protein n=1 Tax=Rhizopogon vinicolor AM-OR11-026 TaxID=1314800 RepID=A0A1B7NIG5_9AGAM|nr:hypothetical protein K503DRAFT_677759 [Rhizopogon vinicolor AM-OR11-026]
MAGSAIRAALANPYAQHNVSPHYYQAYTQVMQPTTNAEGYTLSSTYSSMPRYNTGGTNFRSDPRDASSYIHARTNDKKPDSTGGQTYSGWHQPGNCRCTRQGCAFTGSKKSVETHMMDRHFIFPPGWQKKDEWDTDPSLKGKPIAIQGTSLILDSQEAIDAWIAERRNRFPTTHKVEDKKRKLEEAVARGQLTPEDMGLQGWKKRRKDDSSVRGHQPRGRARGRGMGRFTSGTVSRFQDPSGWTKLQAAPTLPLLIPAKQQDNPDSDSNSDNDAPEVVSSKPPQALQTGLALAAQDKHESQSQPPCKPVKRPPQPQPRPPPRNSFTSRPTLLRSLLLPEIRITVSNLSQAIRFLVDNDFLRGVEMKPGEAQQKMIEVVQSTRSEADQRLNSQMNGPE